MEPALFSRITGQEKARRFLENVMGRRKIPHAWLFTGIAGIGKTTTARAFAMTLNCKAPSGVDACGACPPCRQFMGKNFPDFIAVEPQGQNIKIEQIRELNRQMGFPPVSGGYRVIVMRQAETMRREASNAFLKTLEEPPSGNILILNATEPRDLLPTIVSRCQRVAFRPLSGDEIREWLMVNKSLSFEAARIVAQSVGGSLARAIRMGESDYLEKRAQWVSNISTLRHGSKAQAVQMAFESAGKGKKSKGGAQDGDGRTGLLEMLGLWASWYRDLLVVKTGAASRFLINIDFEDRLKESALNISLENLIDSFATVDRAERDIYTMKNPALVLENAAVRLQNLAGGGNAS